MKSLKCFLLYTVIAGTAFGCTTQPTPIAPSLVASSWRLIQIQSMDDKVYTPAEKEMHIVQFETDGQLIVQADCNRGTGSWQQDASQIIFGAIASTRAMCRPGSLDTRFLRDLANARSFVIQDSYLFLATMADEAILRFEPTTIQTATIQPSFACSDVQTSVEITICQDNELAELDQQLDALYRLAMQRLPEPEHNLLQATQGTWTSRRNECWKDEELSPCIQNQYTLRIAELQIETGSLPTPMLATYQCDSGQTLELYFYKDTAQPALVLNNANREILLFLQASASGARYANENTEFWERGNEAIYTNFENTTKCTLK